MMKRLERNSHPYLPEFLHYLRKENDTLLDIGCGLLPNTVYFTKKGFKVISVDLNLEYLLYSQNLFPRATSVCGDITRLPFKQNLFNGAIIVDLLEHLPKENLTIALEETIRVMKKNSYIFLHIPLEGSFAYRFLRVLRKIWTRDPNHKYDYKYGEIKRVLSRFPFKIEKEWINKRLKFFNNPDISAVIAITDK